MTTKQQADDEIHECQLLNFPVNTLTGAFSLNLGENAESIPMTSSYPVIRPVAEWLAGTPFETAYATPNLPPHTPV